jgi:hypothetical protein
MGLCKWRVARCDVGRHRGWPPLRSQALGQPEVLTPNPTQSCATTERIVPRAAAALFLSAVVLVALAGLWVVNRQLCELATLMLKVDVFAFGGGFASVPLMHHEVVGVYRWLDSRAPVFCFLCGSLTY